MALTLRGNGQITSDNYTIDSDGDVTAVNAAVSGTLGVTGTTSMGGNLEVDGIIEIDKTGDHPALRFVEDGSNTRAYMGSGDWAINGLANDDFGISSSSTGDLVLGTGAGQERLRIDNAGRVTKPNQVYFDAFLSGNYTTPSSGVYNMSTNANWGTHTNTGGHFVTGTGTFTAPIAGRYLFYAGLGVQSYPTSSYLSCEFEINGSRKYIHWFSNYGTSYAAANNTAVINLSANDYVRLVSETHVIGTYIGHSSGIYSHWGGYLIG